MAVNPAAQAASVVFAATRPMPSKSMAESVLPGLKPYQPNHRIKPPVAAIGQVVRHHWATTVALESATQTRTKDDGASERHESANGMHNGRSRKIVEAYAQRRKEVAVAAHHGQKAIRTPGPVTDDGIDEARNRNAVQQVAHEIQCVRSLRPDVMVEQVSAKANWKSQKAKNATPVVS